MKKIKIIIIAILFLVWNANYDVCAEEFLESKSFSELLSIISQDHDNPELVYRVASELEHRAPATKDELLQLFELVGETGGGIQQKFIKAISNTTDFALAPVFIREQESESPMRVAAACGMSGKLKLKEAVPGLIAVIECYGEIDNKADTEQERAVATATLALGKIRDERGLEILTTYMGKLGGYDSSALAEFGARALDILLKKIKEYQAFPSGQSAIRAISLMTDPKASIPLNRIIEQKDHPARKSAVVAMFNIDPASTTRRLLEMWNKEKEPFIEERLLLHINRARLRDRSLCPLLIHILAKNTSVPARKGAALALGRIGGAEAVKALKKAADYDSDYLVRVYANQALKMADQSLE